MKILHVAETIKGGVATVLNQLVQDQINRYGSENIDILIPGNQREYIALDEDDNIKTYDRTGRNLISLMLLTRRFLNLIKSNDYDVIHAHSTFAGVIVRMALVICRVRSVIVYCPHAFSFVMKSNPIKKRIYFIIEKLLEYKTDVIICVSKFELENSIKLGMSKKKLSLVYNGVPERNFSYSNNEFIPLEIFSDRNNNGSLNSDVINVLFVGRFDYQKGVDILEKAIRNILSQGCLNKKFKFNIAGDIVNDKTNDLFKNFEHNTNVEVNLLGWLNKKELEYFYFNCDVVVMPSRWEGFGLVVAEAYQFGKPVIGSDNTALSEIIINNKTGFLFTTDSVEELTKILMSLDVSELRAMSEECLHQFKTKYMSKIMTYETDKIYNKCLLSKRG